MKRSTKLLAISIIVLGITALAVAYSNRDSVKTTDSIATVYGSTQDASMEPAKDYEALYNELQSAYNELNLQYQLTQSDLHAAQADMHETMGALSEQWDIVEALNSEKQDWIDSFATLEAWQPLDPYESMATAYTLMESKHGIARTGYDLNGKDITERVIAVDPKLIPLKSQVYIEFPEPYTHMDGWYSAEDTGSKIKGTRIDVFFGGRAQADEDAANQFGVRYVKIIVVIPPK